MAEATQQMPEARNRNQSGVTESKTALRDARGRYLPNHGAPGPGRGNGVKLGDVLRHHVDPDELAEALMKLVRRGDFPAIAYVYNRLEGMPKQSVDAKVEARQDIALTWGER